MQLVFTCLFVAFVTVSTTLNSQQIIPDKNKFDAIQVSLSYARLGDRQTIRVVKDSAVAEVDAPTFAKLRDLDFQNGTIEVEVLSKLLPDAPPHARGFIGIAFRINADNSRFESVYLRPVNAVSDEQLRRNRAIQYFSYPNYKFDQLRKDAPGEYESYAPIGMNKWIKMKIHIQGTEAHLYLDGNKEPCLIVKDLKSGADAKGAIGLWVSVGTEGFFSNLKITKTDSN